MSGHRKWKNVKRKKEEKEPGLTSEQRLDSYAKVLGKDATGIVDLDELTPAQRRRYHKKMRHTAAVARRVDEFLGGPIIVAPEEEGTS